MVKTLDIQKRDIIQQIEKIEDADVLLAIFNFLSTKNFTEQELISRTNISEKQIINGNTYTHKQVTELFNNK
jgi:hypothetical protein